MVGHQHRDLLAGLHRDEGGAQRDLGLAEADIAADDPVHGLVGFQVGDHLFDGGGLIGGFLEGEAGLEGAVLGLARQHVRALAGGAARIQIQELRGDVANALRRLAARLLPLLAAELVQRRGLGRRAGIARHQVQRLHRHIQLVAVGIFEHQEFAGVAGDVHGLQPDVASDAVGLVHHRRADAQVRQLLEDFGRIALGAAAAPLLPRAIAEQLRFGENLERRGLEPQSRDGGRHRDAQRLSGLAMKPAKLSKIFAWMSRRAADRAAVRGGRRIRPRAKCAPGSRRMCATNSAAGCSARGSMRTAAGATLGKFCIGGAVSGGHSKLCSCTRGQSP